MGSATIFISHRSEYARQVREMKRAIAGTSRGEIRVFISEEIPHGADWRKTLEDHLQSSESLFLVYGAPYEDWSWCFYEAGYFAGREGREKQLRTIYCIVRPGVPPPGPLSHVQMITDSEGLMTALTQIYHANEVDFDPQQLRIAVNTVGQKLFGKPEEYKGYPQIFLTANNTEFVDGRIPANARLTGNPWIFQELFGVYRTEMPWSELVAGANSSVADNEHLFMHKWLEETSRIILAAKDGRFVAPQTIFIAKKGGKRCRFLLYQARLQGDDSFSCEFLVVDDVGGPNIGLSRDLLSLLTAIRRGFRFRYEFVERFRDLKLQGRSAEDRKVLIEEIHRTIFNLMTEAEMRGNFSRADLLSAFDEDDRDYLTGLMNYWPAIQVSLNRSLGLSDDGVAIIRDGLLGPDLERFRKSVEALRLLNRQFLSVCCNRLSKRMLVPEEQREGLHLQLEKLVAEIEEYVSVDAA